MHVGRQKHSQPQKRRERATRLIMSLRMAVDPVMEKPQKTEEHRSGIVFAGADVDVKSPIWGVA